MNPKYDLRRLGNCRSYLIISLNNHTYTIIEPMKNVLKTWDRNLHAANNPFDIFVYPSDSPRIMNLFFIKNDTH